MHCDNYLSLHDYTYTLLQKGRLDTCVRATHRLNITYSSKIGHTYVDDSGACFPHSRNGNKANVKKYLKT